MQQSDVTIFQAADGLAGLRDSGIKNTASAISEIVDNSIEAGAKSVKVVIFEEPTSSGQRVIDKISSIAIIDNGSGMDKDLATLCLAVGGGNRKQRKGLGRFGYGLPNSSLSQARRVEVFTWKQKDKIFHNYLDFDEVQSKKLEKVYEATESKIPKELEKYISKEFQNSGTIVYWKKCDRTDVFRGETLFRHMEDQLCRTFRHYLDDDDNYGERIDLTYEIDKKDFQRSFLPNDPLYIMTPNNCPNFENEASNTLINDEEIEVPFIDQEGAPKTSKIKVRFSVAKPETQKNFGSNSPTGKHYGKNTGISVVRKAREIDFGNWGFFDGNEYRERWWGAEIRFEPELDELFGLTNNKQNTRRFYYEDDTLNKEKFGEEDYEERLNTDLSLQMRRLVSQWFSRHHKEHIKIIKNRGKGTGTGRGGSSGKTSSDIANDVLKNDDTMTRSFTEGSEKSEEQTKKELVDLLKSENPEITTEELIKITNQKMAEKRKVDLSFKGWPGEQFFTVEIAGETSYAVINRDHPYYTEFYDPLFQLDDSKYVKAVDLLLMAFARMEDEQVTSREEAQKVRGHWGRHLQNFLDKLKENN